MSDEARQQAVEAARALEKRGEIDQAVRQYLRVGAVEEAARALASAKRFGDAGHLVMEWLGVGPGLVGGLDDQKKRLAAKAAVCFAQAGEARKAVDLFVALGDLARAAEVMERAGDAAEAARLRSRIEKKSDAGSAGSAIASAAERARAAYKLKRFVDAAQLFEEAKMPFEAAACFAEAGETGRCLEAVVRVPREHPKYRTAAAQAIRLSSEMNAVHDKLDGFLAGFLVDAPKDEREIDALYALAKVYRANHSLEKARDLLRKVAAVRPGHRDVAKLIAQLEVDVASVPKTKVAAPVGGGDDFFPDLPDLPPPPVAPPKAQKTAYIPPMSGQFGAVRVPSRGNPAVEAVRSPAPPVASPGAPASMPGELGDGAVIADRYRIVSKIGQGGMASVYRAHDLELGEDIAMKLFLQPSEDAQLIARFKQELTLSRGLSHPNIVRLYDIGQHQGCRFLTMELLQGTDLSAIIEGGKPLPLERGVRYMLQACAALALAHDKGVIHRDIKPANFFITKEDILKVMDFGIAKKSTAPAAMTQAGFIAGTPAYMSPEQINNFSAVSHRTDIYALGIVAYEMFTGLVPFDHAEMMQLLMMHLTATAPAPSTRNPSLPPELDAIILNLLEKDPAKRIQSCQELGERLEKLIAK